MDEYLANTSGFQDVEDKERYIKVDTALKQIQHQLDHLSRVWKVLPENVYYSALGTMVNRVFENIIRVTPTMRNC